MTQPINNYAIGNKLREITGRSWDARLESDVNPVVIVNSDDLAFTVSNALPKAGTNQTLKGYSTSTKAGESITAGTGITPLSVTATKKLYIGSFQVSGAAAFQYIIKDGGSGGTVKAVGTVGASVFAGMVFNPPLEFSTDVWIDTSLTQTHWVALQGWEE